MKKIFTILFCFIASINIAFAETVTVGEGATTSVYCPIALNGISTKYSLTQQLYTSTELGGAAKTITGITFYYYYTEETHNTTVSRDIEVWLMESDITAFGTNFSYKLVGGKAIVGTKVFDSTQELSENDYTINFTTNFEYSGTKNLIVTVYDKTGATGGTNRHRADNLGSGVYKCIRTYTNMTPTWDILDLYNYAGTQSTFRPQITFNFAEASTPDTPTGLAVEPAATSASVTWNAVAAATSYKLQQSANGSSWSDLASPATNSYSWTGLTPETTYYVRVAATNANGDSDYSDAVSFTTDALHTHNAITFDKWTATDVIPTSGNYYLANDVEITSYIATSITGTMNLCLNGHTVTYTRSSGGISVSSTGSLSIYDHVGGGVITSPNGTATIQVASGGSVTIYEGSVVNSDDATKAIKTSDNGALTLPFSENSDNSETYSLAANCGHTVNVNLARSWVADGYYSTLCLPFALSNAQVTSIFGTGTELAKLTDSSISGEEITITFTSASSIEAGKPYIILPTQNAVNPSINNVTLSSSTTDATTTYVDFIGTLSPTYLAASEDILFLGANNAIGWPAAAGYLKGMRAYFQLHSLPAGAPALRHARLIAPGHSTPTALDEANENKNIQKRLENGQLIIIRDGKKYNVIGGQQ